jgi:hypothetical protein
MALGDITVLQEQSDGSFKEKVISLQDIFDDSLKNYVAFSTQNTNPANPTAGKKLFLDASGKFSTIDNAGNIEALSAQAAAPSGTGIVIVDNGSFGVPISVDSFAPADHTHTTFSDTPPLTPKQGDRWIDSTTLRVYERLNNSWIEPVQ